ncbi:MAG: hypothetical protein K2P90_04275, partial [Holosporales bacterium]|nr:hypothetical protein [Holosporales bacterium]
GAIQNIQIANSFLVTAQANLGTVIENISTMSGDVMTLLNEVVSTQNNQASVQKLIESMGMAAAPTSRDHEEGSVIKTLRQGGTGQALYFRTRTENFLSTNGKFNTFTYDVDVSVSPQNSIIAAIEDAEAAEAVFGAAFSGDQFATPTVEVKGSFEATDASNDPNAGTATYKVTVTMGDVTYTLEDFDGAGDALVLALAAPAEGDTLTLVVGGAAGAIATITTGEAEANDNASKLKADIEAALKSIKVNGQFNPESETEASPGDSAKGILGATNFKLSADSNYGTGTFTMSYDGQNVSFSDSYGTLIQSYPLDPSVLKASGELAAKVGDVVELPIGNIGTLYVNKKATGERIEGEFQFTTQGEDYKAFLIVSSSDGSRTIDLPDLTNPVTLWGEKITIDSNKLQTDMAYKEKIKGMIDHAYKKTSDVYQSISNLMGTLEQDLTAQNACMESLHDLDETVSEADPLEVANDVFNFTQQYKQVFEVVKLISSLDASEKRAANAIAELAAQS